MAVPRTGPVRVTSVVRLIGEDADVRAIAREAVAVLRNGPEAGAPLFRHLWLMHARRRRLGARGAVDARLPSGRTGRAWRRAVWGVFLGVGLTSLLVSAAMLGPADGKNALLEPGLALTVALVAGAIALPALLLALVLRPPDQASARIGETVSVLVGVLCAAVLVHRLFVGANDDRGFTWGVLGPSLTTTVVAVLLVSAIAIRADIVRRRSTASAAGRDSTGRDSAGRDSTGRDSTGSRVTMRRLREDAAWVATAAGTDDVSERDWARRLDALAARGSDPSAVAQARAMTPVAWLGWLAYDGEVDITGIVPRT